MFKVSHQYKVMDSAKVRTLTRIYTELLYSNSFRQKANLYADSAIKIAAQLPNRINLIRLYLRLGVAHHGKGEFIEALDYYQKGITVSIKEKDQISEAGFYMSMSDIYNKITDYANAIDVCEKAIKIYTNANDLGGVASIYNNLCGTYIALKDFTTAYQYATKALQLFKTLEPGSRGVASIQQVIAKILLDADDAALIKIGFSGNKRYEAIIQLVQSALPIATTAEDPNLKAELLVVMASAYKKMNNLAAANLNYDLAVAEGKKGSDINSNTTVLATVGAFYLQNGQPGQGLRFLYDALIMSRKSGILEIEADITKQLSEYYQSGKQYDSALAYYQQFHAVTNQILNKDKEKEITRKKLMLDFSIKEKAYAVQQERVSQQLTEKKLEIQFKNRLAWMLGILIVIILIGAWLIFKSRQKTVALNRTIEAQRQSLAELVQVKDKIFSVMTHDLRSPVNSLYAFLFLLEQEEIQKDKLAAYATELGQTLKSTSTLMENLFNWASSQLQGFAVKKEAVQIKALLPDIIAAFSDSAKQKNINIEQDIDHTVFVWADKNLLALILRNLISNALKFSYSNQTIRIKALQQGSQWVIMVSDQGIGMSADMMHQFNHTAQHSFESHLGTNKEKGTGLGLVLCKSFIQMMDGQLLVKANQPSGCIMQLYLPIAQN